MPQTPTRQVDVGLGDFTLHKTRRWDKLLIVIQRIVQTAYQQTAKGLQSSRRVFV